MFKEIKVLLVSVSTSLFMLPLVVSAATLTVSCAGTPTATNITWAGSPAGGVAPLALLWSNGSTSTSQTIAVTPGTYSMNLQVTDASSTVATTTCSATVVSSGPSTADQITSLLNQIGSLKMQLAQLLAQQAASGGSGTATSTPNGCFNFNHDIHQGDQGDDVKDLQKTLASDPSVFPSGLVTGFFGHMTEDGVKKFQKKHGINATGYFGPMSRIFFEGQCTTGDDDHDGVPNSIDKEDGNNNDEHGLDSRSATSTIGSEHGKDLKQESKDNGDNSRDN